MEFGDLMEKFVLILPAQQQSLKRRLKKARSQEERKKIAFDLSATEKGIKRVADEIWQLT